MDELKIAVISVVSVVGLLFLAIWVASDGCMRGWTVLHSIPAESKPCERECALAVAKGGGSSVYAAEQNYYRCLRSCPGVTTELECRGD